MGYTCALPRPSRMGDLLGPPPKKGSPQPSRMGDLLGPPPAVPNGGFIRPAPAVPNGGFIRPAPETWEKSHDFGVSGGQGESSTLSSAGLTGWEKGGILWVLGVARGCGGGAGRPAYAALIAD